MAMARRDYRWTAQRLQDQSETNADSVAPETALAR